MSGSQAPSGFPPKSGGSGPYVIGILLLLAVGGGILYKMQDKPVPPPPVEPVKTVEPVINTPPPPPPPPPEEVDAGTPDSGKTALPATAGNGLKGPLPCGGKCGDGVSSAALESEIRNAARTAQGCYNRALRSSGSEASGSITVSVQVGPTGSVCGASVVQDDLHASDITQCVLGRFRSRSFPAPERGCVVLNQRIKFELSGQK